MYLFWSDKVQLFAHLQLRAAHLGHLTLSPYHTARHKHAQYAETHRNAVLYWSIS